MIDGTQLEDIYALSPLQGGILFHTLYTPHAGLYIEQLSFSQRNIDITLFQRAVQFVVGCHAALRASFHWEELSNPVQIIHSAVEVPLSIYDWSHLSATQRDTELAEFLAADRLQGFDLQVPPLLRLAAFQVEDEAVILVFSHHHLLMDRWSQNIFLQEVYAAYNSVLNGDLKHAAPEDTTYSKYIGWLQQQDLVSAEQFWKKELQHFSELTRIALPKPSVPAPPGEAIWEASLPEPLSTAIQMLARQYSLTTSTILQGAWGLLLSTYTGKSDLAWGMVVSGRPVEIDGAEHAIGLFINTLPVRVKLELNLTIAQWLVMLGAHLREVQLFFYTPLAQIQQWSGLGAGNGLFEALFVYQNLPFDETLWQAVDKLQIEHIEQHSGGSNYPLALTVSPQQGLQTTIQLRFSFDRARFDTVFIEHMAANYEALLNEIVSAPEQTLMSLSGLSLNEQHILLNNFSSGLPLEKSSLLLHELIEMQVARTPQGVAVIADDATLTYAELDRRANAVAYDLRILGVGPNKSSAY